MFRTIGEPGIINRPSLPPATVDSNVLPSTELLPQIYTRLNGTRTTCGAFLVVYAPPS